MKTKSYKKRSPNKICKLHIKLGIKSGLLSSIPKKLTSKIFIMVFGDMLLLSILSFSNRMLFSNAQAKLAAAKSLKVTFATRKEQKNN